MCRSPESGRAIPTAACATTDVRPVASSAPPSHLGRFSSHFYSLPTRVKLQSLYIPTVYTRSLRFISLLLLYSRCNTDGRNYTYYYYYVCMYIRTHDHRVLHQHCTPLYTSRYTPSPKQSPLRQTS